MATSFLIVITCTITYPPDPAITANRIFGPEITSSKYKHPASITELANGDLYLVYYGGSGEYAADSTLFGALKKKGEKSWSNPEAIRPRPKAPEGNPVVWQAPDGTIWLFSVTRHGPTWADSRISVRTSTDGARTWGHPTQLTSDRGTMVRGKPIVLNNGDYLLPVYRESGEDREFVGAATTSFFLRYDVKKKKWSETNHIKSRLGNLQPAPAQLTDDYLVCYCRRGGGYDGKNTGFIVRSESRDGGRTWAPGTETKFPNPNAAVDLLRLKNGHLLLVFNDSMEKRTPLTVAISTDQDKTYPHRRNIAEGPKDFGYPYAIQTRDEKIHIVYTTERRSVIMHAVFDESAILRK